jgi:signal transduction histidine kinase
LLHALNQPLTGLQCSMEVALAALRTPEQYVQGLREGLELTERMRALVEALREVVDGEKEKYEDTEKKTIDLKTLLREVLDDLEPVAEVKRVRIEPDWTDASSLAVQAGRQRLGTVVFRLVESALALADPGSALRIETGGAMNRDEAWIVLRWHAESSRPAFSRAELGMLVAQAGWEQIGAHWEREQTEDLDTVTVRLPRVSENV